MSRQGGRWKSLFRRQREEALRARGSSEGHSQASSALGNSEGAVWTSESRPPHLKTRTADDQSVHPPLPSVGRAPAEVRKVGNSPVHSTTRGSGPRGGVMPPSALEAGQCIGADGRPEVQPLVTDSVGSGLGGGFRCRRGSPVYFGTAESPARRCCTVTGGGR